MIFNYLHGRNSNIILLVNVGLLILAGHLGASITHGEDYILQPLRKEKPLALQENVPVFVAAIQPILEKKCYNCHNESKAKGELIMTSLETLLKGGKNGALWQANDVENSLLLQRVKLPLEHEEHMPPKEKPQLTASEIHLLQTWIQAGANVKQTLADIKPGDSLFILVNNLLQNQADNNKTANYYDFPAASDKKIKALNHPFRAVYPIALGSPALHAEIFVRQAYKPEFLQELSAVQEQLVSLNLTNMPIKDEDLKTIAKFKNLEKLILNGTDITGKYLADLIKLKKLESLSLSKTAINENYIQQVKEFPALKKVYIWNTGISQEAVAELVKALPKIEWEGGYVPNETEVLQLSPPLLRNKSMILAPDELVVFNNKLPGVSTRYTTDGSEPDSLNAPQYQAPLHITEYTVLKIRNFKVKWKSSELKTFTFFPQGQRPTQVKLRTMPEPTFEHKGALTLYDERKGSADNIKSSLWLGFKDEPLDAYFYFAKPPQVQEIIISISKNIGARAFPPMQVEVWGGADTTHMKPLASIIPKQPTTYEPTEITGIRVPLPPSDFPYYRVLARPLKRVPDWHYEKQYGARIAVDEVFFY
ncbi:MAG: c-type cytochrome domain-containing protein [Saprospiraceae bacterium]